MIYTETKNTLNFLSMTRQILDANTNTCYLSWLLMEQLDGNNVIHRISSSGIEVRILIGTRDIWCRDYMPIQIYENKYIGYEYTPDYLEHHGSMQTNLQTNPARILVRLGIDVTQSGIILDGGNVIKTNKGIIMVDKIFKENEHLRKDILVNRLENYFENEIIFLPWDKAEIYGHADGIVRYIENGRVLMSNYHQYDKAFADEYLRILSKHFDVEVLDYNVENPCKFNWCYINFLRISNKIFIPQLEYEDYSGQGCEAAPLRWYESEGRKIKTKSKPRWYHKHIEEDDQALEQFKRIFPNCEIIQVSCPRIVEKGGGLHCISWNVKEENT